MAVVRVYEGEFGQVDAQEFLVEALKGGAIGGGAQVLSEMILSKVFPTTSPMMNIVISSAIPLGLAVYLRENNPSLALGMALGSSAIAIYKLVRYFLTTQSGYAGPQALGTSKLPTLADYMGYGKIELEELAREGNPNVELEAVK